MPIGTVGKVLIALSVIAFFYAINMPVALPGSSVVNIGLISERQNMFMLCGIFFIGGIVLFAVGKLKQTSDENAIEALRQREIQEAARQVIADATERGSELAFTSIPGVWQRHFVGLSQGGVSVVIRLVIGLICGQIVRSLGYSLGVNIGIDWELSTTLSDVIAALLVVYVFRKVALPTALRHVFLFDLLLVGAFSANWMIIEGSLPIGVHMVIGFLVIGLATTYALGRKKPFPNSIAD